jgi:uncharacterized protein YbjT (DUF2867 family)
VRVHVVDFSTLNASDVDPSDDLFCAIGTTMKKAGTKEAFRHVDHDLPLRVAELAVASGVKRLAVVSSAGADARAHSFYMKTKGELEDALAKLPLEELHIMRPSFLLGDRAESRPGEAVLGVVTRAAQGLLVGGLRKWRAIDADDVARAMVTVMVSPAPGNSRCRVYEHDAILALAGRST